MLILCEGHGMVITCAHVVAARDDEDEGPAAKIPPRIGRRKVVIVLVMGGDTPVYLCTRTYTQRVLQHDDSYPRTCNNISTTTDVQAPTHVRVPVQVVMFPSGRAFIAQCASTVETIDGAEDVALMILGAEITPGMHKRGASKEASSSSASSAVGLPAADIAPKAVARYAESVCQ